MNFNDIVYDIVRKIPPGMVASYGQIALLAGNARAARAVGHAMRCCPPGARVPCHRVIRQDGSLAEGAAFLDQGGQRKLLEGEGVILRGDGKVDMNVYGWKGETLNM